VIDTAFIAPTGDGGGLGEGSVPTMILRAFFDPKGEWAGESFGVKTVVPAVSFDALSYWEGDSGPSFPFVMHKLAVPATRLDVLLSVASRRPPFESLRYFVFLSSRFSSASLASFCACSLARSRRVLTEDPLSVFFSTTVLFLFLAHRWQIKLDGM